MGAGSMDDRLAKLASSLNRSRHRSVADGPRKRRLRVRIYRVLIVCQCSLILILF